MREKILNGKYKPGDPILEISVINELGISRTPFREALKLLQKENLINIFPRRGAFITTVSLDKIREIYQIREIVEGEVARLVAPYISEQELSKIEKKLLTIKKLYEDTQNINTELAVKIGEELHDLIFYTLGNKTLIQVFENLKIDRNRGCDFASRGVGNALIFLDQHLEIITALKERNGIKAKNLLNKHIKDAKEAILV